MRPHLLPLLLAPLGLLLAGCSGGTARDIEAVLADLTSESPRARSRAERTLAEHGRSVLKPLSNLVTLKDVEKTAKDFRIKGDPKSLRIPAARALAVIAAKASLARPEAETAAAPLLEVLHGKDRALRLEAAKALGAFTQLSAPANDLILLFREDDEALAAAGTEALGHNALRSVYSLVPAQEPAASAAEKDWTRLLERIASTDDDIRLDTVRELAASRDPRAAPLLLDRVARDQNRDVRYAALCYATEILKSGTPDDFPDKLFAQLPASFAKDADSRVVLLAARLLRERKPELVDQFLSRIAAATRACEEALFRVATDTSHDPGARADAIDALGLLPSERRDDLLAKLLDPAASERARVQRAAAGVLATSTSQRAADALEKAMATGGDSIVKLLAAQALGRRGDLDAVKYLVDLLRDGEAKIRTDAADALGTLGAKAVPLLVEHLKTSLQRLAAPQATASEKYTAWGVVSGLGHIAEHIGADAAAALDPVAAAAECEDEDVRRVAVVALGHFQGDRAIAALAKRLKDADESVQWHAITALERHGSAAVPALVAALQDDAVYGFVATSIARVGDGEALKPLLDRLGTAKGEGRVDLVWSIGELLRRHPSSPHAAAVRSALEAASCLADAPDVAHAAAYALEKATGRPASEQ